MMEGSYLKPQYHRPRGSPGKRDARGWLDTRRHHRDGDGDMTCRCGAYRHPHRMFGGRCSPQGWVELFYSYTNPDCEHCINLDQRECQVVSGVEKTFHCPALRDYIRFEGIKLYGRAKAAYERSCT